MERARADNTSMNWIKKAISLKTQLCLAEKRDEALGDLVGMIRLEVSILQNKLSLSMAKNHVAKQKLQQLEKKATWELSKEVSKASWSAYKLDYLECKGLVKQILSLVDVELPQIQVLMMAKALVVHIDGPSLAGK